MKWLYYIPSEIPEDGTMYWEDVYVKPEHDSFNGRSIWLTVDALGRPDDGDYAEERKEMLEQLGDKEYVFTTEADMVVRQNTMTVADLLGWVKVWIKETMDDPEPELVEGTEEGFAGSNQHAEQVAEAVRIRDAVLSGKIDAPTVTIGELRAMIEKGEDVPVPLAIPYGQSEEDKDA